MAGDFQMSNSTADDDVVVLVPTSPDEHLSEIRKRLPGFALSKLEYLEGKSFEREGLQSARFEQIRQLQSQRSRLREVIALSEMEHDRGLKYTKSDLRR